jgi:transposase-like protein
MMEVSMSPKVTKRKRRLFTPKLKTDAVRLVRGPMLASFSMAFMCRELGIAPSTRDAALLVDVRAAFQASRRCHGSPRVHAELQAEVIALRAKASTIREGGTLTIAILALFDFKTQFMQQENAA